MHLATPSDDKYGSKCSVWEKVSNAAVISSLNYSLNCRQDTSVILSRLVRLG